MTDEMMSLELVNKECKGLDGVGVDFGGFHWKVPPLSLGSLKRLIPDFITLRSAEFNLEQINSSISIVLSALLRNYPKITEDHLEEHLDLSTMADVIKAIMSSSGLVDKGEAVADQQ